jgi:hypothetical protein
MDDWGFLFWGCVRVCVLAWLGIAFLRWLLTPPHWRDGEGPLIDEGERMSTEFSWLRWFTDRLTLRFWRW